VSSSQVFWLNPSDPPDAFPDIEEALQEPDGLLAAGGDLSSERLLIAYRKGIFPWFDEGQPILWWSPDPRCVLRPADFHVSKRLRRHLLRSSATLTFNHSFGDVVRACAAPRASQQGTWITADMILAYEHLHAEGWAHSVEVWQDGQRVGGLYGLAIGKVFFGESMYSLEPNTSKFAMFGLSRFLLRNNVALIDCQVISRHLLTLGATMISRLDFRRELESACAPATRMRNWPPNPVDVSSLSQE
jgi:leucyl/phenylalanyl-tRNA--protein transferase